MMAAAVLGLATAGAAAATGQPQQHVVWPPP